MDKIYLNELVFYGYHGVLKEETKLGQTFRVSLILGLSTKKAGISDSVEDTVSYADVYETVKEIVEGKPFKLIEALAEKNCIGSFNWLSSIRRSDCKTY